MDGGGGDGAGGDGGGVGGGVEGDGVGRADEVHTFPMHASPFVLHALPAQQR